MSWFRRLPPALCGSFLAFAAAAAPFRASAAAAPPPRPQVVLEGCAALRVEEIERLLSLDLELADVPADPRTVVRMTCAPDHVQVELTDAGGDVHASRRVGAAPTRGSERVLALAASQLLESADEEGSADADTRSPAAPRPPPIVDAESAFNPRVRRANDAAGSEVGDPRHGVTIELGIGAGMCPDCPANGPNLAFATTGAVGYRLPNGLAASLTMTWMNAEGDPSCWMQEWHPDDTPDCYGDYENTFVAGADVRFYPLTRTVLRIDPYMGIGAGYGTATSRPDSAAVAHYDGLVLGARLGLLARLTRYVSMGGSFSRSLALWSARCDPGNADDRRPDQPSCEDEEMAVGSQGPDFWLTTIDTVITIW